MNTRCRKMYAVYKGDTFLDLGTLDELAERLNVTRATLKYRTTPTYKRKIAERGSENSSIVIKIEDDDDE